MKTPAKPPIFKRDRTYESASRLIRWICLATVVITYPFSADWGPLVFSLVGVYALYSAARQLLPLTKSTKPRSRLNDFVFDNTFIIFLCALSGGTGSPYYPFFFLVIIAIIASYGIAGFALALSTQIIITFGLSFSGSDPLPVEESSLLLLRIVFILLFCLLAEQSVRTRDEEYLLETAYTDSLEYERQRLLALLNSLSVGVIALDPKGNVRLCNGSALALLDTNRQIVGLPVDRLLPLSKEGRSIKISTLARQANSQSNRQDLMLKSADGSEIALDLTIAPIRSHRQGREITDGSIIVMRDITKQKSLDEERDEFISVTSHELRTPLAIAEADLSTVLLPKFTELEPKAKTMIEQAYENVVFLSELVQDLTTLAKVERGRIVGEVETVDLKLLTEELSRDFRPVIEQKKLKFETNFSEQLGRLMTSEHAVREILQNFLTNAIKYTSSGSISFSAVRKSDGQVEFSVRDTGIGVAATDKARVFDRFYRAEDYRTRQTNGTGLGLYISRKLADRLGGEIIFTSRLDHGSTFKLTIPPLVPYLPVKPSAQKAQIPEAEAAHTH